MRKFSASRSFKKYTGHTKAMRKLNKVRRGGIKKKHFKLLNGKSTGCIVIIIPVILFANSLSFFLLKEICS